MITNISSKVIIIIYQNKLVLTYQFPNNNRSFNFIFQLIINKFI